jgi:hypothetical protein
MPYPEIYPLDEESYHPTALTCLPSALGEQPRQVQEHAGLLQLVVVPAHRGQKFLAGRGARFRIPLIIIITRMSCLPPGAVSLLACSARSNGAVNVLPSGAEWRAGATGCWGLLPSRRLPRCSTTARSSTSTAGSPPSSLYDDRGRSNGSSEPPVRCEITSMKGADDRSCLTPPGRPPWPWRGLVPGRRSLRGSRRTGSAGRSAGAPCRPRSAPTAAPDLWW